MRLTERSRMENLKEYLKTFDDLSEIERIIYKAMDEGKFDIASDIFIAMNEERLAIYQKYSKVVV